MEATVSSKTFVSVRMQESGAEVLEEALKYSKTIGKVVAGKLGLTGDEASKKAAQIQRTLRRVRVAIENAA